MPGHFLALALICLWYELSKPVCLSTDQSLAHYFYKKALYSRRLTGVDLPLTMLCKCTGNPCVRDTMSPPGPRLAEARNREEGSLSSLKLEFQVSA